MKKIFAIALAVVMVLSIASVAGALWEKPASDAVTNDNFGYSIDVIKYTLKSGYVGTSAVEPNDAATAVNNADVYVAIKLSVTDTEYADEAEAEVTFTSLGLANGRNSYTPDVTGLAKGEYYFVPGQGFRTMQEIANNNAWSAVIFATCLDTETAKVTATVTAERPLDNVAGDQVADSPFTWNGYTVAYYDTFGGGTNPDIIRFTKGNNWIQFTIDEDGVAKRYEDSGNFAGTSFEWDLYTALGIDPSRLSAGSVYMTEDNLRSVFGFSFKSTDSVTWNANSTPIILDPTVSIPKTGDNASVIGFAMIMVAVVAAAVAVRKVNA